MKVTTIDLSGTYTATGGMAMTPQAPKPNTRMLGAIVEAKQGSVFFKARGTEKDHRRRRSRVSNDAEVDQS